MDADATPNATRLARLLAVLQKALGHELPNQLVAVQGLRACWTSKRGSGSAPRDAATCGGWRRGRRRRSALAGALAELARLGKPAAAAEAVDLAEAVAEAVAEAKQLAPGQDGVSC